LREIQALDGSQIYNTVQDLRNLLDGLLDATEVNVSGNITSTAGNVTATVGNVTAGGKLFAGNWYGNNITGSGGYRAAYVSIAGEAGYVPSSRQFKRDIEPAEINGEDVLGIRLVKYRYKEAVKQHGNDAPTDVGVIAEEVDELGLSFLIEYDEEGRPLGFKYERLALAVLAAVQAIEKRVSALEA